jgi:hypothetical protein
LCDVLYALTPTKSIQHLSSFADPMKATENSESFMSNNTPSFTHSQILHIRKQAILFICQDVIVCTKCNPDAYMEFEGQLLGGIKEDILYVCLILLPPNLIRCGAERELKPRPLLGLISLLGSVHAAIKKPRLSARNKHISETCTDKTMSPWVNPCQTNAK